MLYKQKKVSIVVVNYNNFELTESCLISIKENTNYKNYKIILIDNGSRNTNLPITIRNGENLGFSKANNQGIGLALKNDSDYVYLLNNDTQITKNWLTSSIELMESDKKIGVIGSRQLDFKRNETISYGDINLLGVDYYFGDVAKEVNWCSGAGILIRADALKKIKLKGETYLDEIYSPAYYEETDLELRIKKNGYKIIANPKSVILHKGGATSSLMKKEDFLLYIFYRNRRIFFRRHFNYFYFLPRIVSDYYKMLRQRKLGILIKAYKDADSILRKK